MSLEISCWGRYRDLQVIIITPETIRCYVPPTALPQHARRHAKTLTAKSFLRLPDDANADEGQHLEERKHSHQRGPGYQ